MKMIRRQMLNSEVISLMFDDVMTIRDFALPCYSLSICSGFGLDLLPRGIKRFWPALEKHGRDVLINHWTCKLCRLPYFRWSRDHPAGKVFTMKAG